MRSVIITLLTLTLTGSLLRFAATTTAADQLPLKCGEAPRTAVSARAGEEASQWRPFWQRPNDFYIPEAFAGRGYDAQTQPAVRHMTALSQSEVDPGGTS